MSGSAVSCEIHVPISPTPDFIRRIHYLAAAMRAYGGQISESPIVVTVGGGSPCDLAAAEPWSAQAGVEWRWVDPELFARYGYYATANERFRYEPRSEYVLYLDADVLVVAPPDLAATGVLTEGGIAGMIAHHSPFALRRRELFPRHKRLWRRVYKVAGLGRPRFVCRHTGAGRDWRKRSTPPYFNLGVLFARAEDAKVIGGDIYASMALVDATVDTNFRCQIALTLAIERQGIPWHVLPVRMNFPNVPSWVERNPDEFRLVQFVHYMARSSELDRKRDFASPAAVEAMLGRSMEFQGNRLVQERLRPLHELVVGAVDE